MTQPIEVRSPQQARDEFLVTLHNWVQYEIRRGGRSSPGAKALREQFRLEIEQAMFSDEDIQPLIRKHFAYIKPLFASA